MVVSSRIVTRISLFVWIIGVSGCSQFMSRETNSAGVQLFKEGFYPAAQLNFEEALSYTPGNPDIQYNLASALHRDGDYEQAEHYYNRALDQNPDHRRSYHALTVLLLEDDRRDDAISLMEGWVEDTPWSTTASVELAWLYEELGDLESAGQQLQFALEIKPSDPESLARLASLREKSGDTGRALALYERSMASGPYRPEIASRVALLRSGGGGENGNSGGSRYVLRNEKRSGGPVSRMASDASKGFRGAATQNDSPSRSEESASRIASSESAPSRKSLESSSASLESDREDASRMR